MIGCADVETSAHWYCHLLGAERGHGGTEYEQILKDGQMILQLHKDDVEDHHGVIVKSGEPVGNGVVLWFEVDDFDEAVKRAREICVQIGITPLFNELAKHMEFWLRDPDGYRVVIAGPSEYARAPIEQ